MRIYEGKTKLIMKYFDFLVKECGMKFQFQTFFEYNGFYGPIDTYSFYNSNGCFTFHNIVQRGEWGWYKSSRFSTNQYDLLEKEINQRDYLVRDYFFTRSWLNALSKIIKGQVYRSNSAFGIPLKEYKFK